MADLVQTYSGHRLHEAPLRFHKKGVWHTVARVLSRWQEPGRLCFKVLAEDGQKYFLEYNKEQDIWKVGLAGPGQSIPQF